MISFSEIYNLVSRIPEGKVATYGQIAALTGYPSHSRYIGRVLSQLDNHSDVPWHRVINAQGKISLRGLNGSDDYQRILLEEEGIEFDEKDRVSLKEFQWQTDNG